MELREFAGRFILVNGFQGITGGYCSSLVHRMGQKFVSVRLLRGYWQIVICLLERAGSLKVKPEV
jgi:hypothetical protein